MARLQFNVAKVLLACGVFLSVHNNMQSTHASSIPIWEFLTRNEKMSYLYSTFAQLVSVHCKATAATSIVPVNQCKHDLLSYGYEKLQTFTDAQLDMLDPYQRGAAQLIWASIMREHPSSTLVTTRKPLSTPPATSIVFITQQQTGISKPNDTPTSTSESQYPKNPMFDSSEHKHQYAMDMDISYGQPSMAHNPQIDVFDAQSVRKTYLTGPSVVRVKPDGSPVEEDKDRAPIKDDDLETYTTMAFATHSDATSNAHTSQQKHRKIATINALKQQYLANLARQQQQLLPPFKDEPRRRREQPVVFHYANIRA